jgi:cytochrome c oxidase cbb3-type subunit 3
MSMSDQLLYRLESDKPFDTVVANIEKQVPENKFRVLAVHDVQETLAEKGFTREPLKIIEVCNSGFANTALSKSINVALFMPCKFTVYPENGKTVVNLARPSMIAQMMPDAGLDDLAGQVEKQLIKVMEESI